MQLRNTGKIHESCAEQRRKEWQEQNKDLVISPGDWVKVAISEGEITEHMWVAVIAVKGNLMMGLIDNDPVRMKSVKWGDLHAFDREEIQQHLKP